MVADDKVAAVERRFRAVKQADSVGMGWVRRRVDDDADCTTPKTHSWARRNGSAEEITAIGTAYTPFL